MEAKAIGKIKKSYNLGTGFFNMSLQEPRSHCRAQRKPEAQHEILPISVSSILYKAELEITQALCTGPLLCKPQNKLSRGKV